MIAIDLAGQAHGDAELLDPHNGRRALYTAYMSPSIDRIAVSINAANASLQLTIRGSVPTAPAGTSEVWLVDFVDGAERRLGILKLVTNNKAEREVVGDETARKSWLKSFLPDRFVRFDPVEDVTPILMSLARDRLSNCVTLRSALADSFGWGSDHVLRSIAVAYRNEISTRWPEAGIVPLHTLMQEAFKGRINTTWVTQWLDAGFPTASSPGLVVDGLPFRLPNPAYVFRHPAALPENVDVRVPFIYSHGDLHANNILCPAVDRALSVGLLRDKPHPPKVWPHLTLIDTPFSGLTSYTFDLAFLAASLRFLLPSIETNRDRDAFVAGVGASFAALTSRAAKSAIPPEADRFSRCISILWTQCVGTQQKMEDDIARAFLTSLAGAALWQAAKTVPNNRQDAMRALLLSAYALREVFELCGVHTIHEPDFSLKTPAAVRLGSLHWTQSATTITEVIDDAAGRGGAVLVLGNEWQTYADGTPLPPKENADVSVAAVRDIGALPLRAIIDWSTDEALRNAIFQGVPVSRYPVTVVPGLPVADAGNSRALPYVHIRGVRSQMSSLATTPPERNRNRAVLYRFFELLRGRLGSDIALIYVGASADVVQEMHPYLHGLWMDARDIRATVVGGDAPSLRGFAEEWNVGLIDANIDDFIAATRDRSSTAVLAATDTDERTLLIADVQRDVDGEVAPQRGALLAVRVPELDHAAFSRAGIVIYRHEPATWVRLDRDVKLFFVGHRVTFPEITNGVPIVRDQFAAYEAIIHERLALRQTHYVAIPARPGAGSSTALRWLAYRFAVDEHIPTLVLLRGGNIAFEAIERLYGLVSRSLLVIADPQDVPADEIAALRTRCNLSQYPVTIVTSVRSNSAGDTAPPMLPIELTEREKNQLVDRLARYCPSVDLGPLRSSATKSLFLLLLEAFGGANVRVAAVVRSLFDMASQNQQQLLATIAVFSHYAHRSSTADLLALSSDFAPKDVNALLSEFDQLLILNDATDSQEQSAWSCRHDVLSRAILQYHLTREFGADEFRYRLSEFAADLVARLGRRAVGRDLAAEYTWALLNPQLETVRIAGVERSAYSRLIGGDDGLPENAMRHIVFDAAATTFPDHVNIISHYGKFLSEEEQRYADADRYLQHAFELEPKNEALSHMIGTRYFDELRYRVSANPHPRADVINADVLALHEAAHEWFTRARRINIGSEYSYVTAIHVDFALIRDEFRRLGVPPSLTSGALVSDRAAEDRITSLLSHAETLYGEALRYVAPETRQYLETVRVELHRLRGDLGAAIQACLRVISERAGAVRTQTRMMLSRYLVERADGNWRNGNVGKANRDYSEAERHLHEVIEDPRRRPDAVRLWFDSARHLPHWRRDDFLSKLHQIEERDVSSLDTLFFLMCLYFADAVEANSGTSWRRFEEYQGKTAAIAAPLAVRRYIREWLVRVPARDREEFRVYPAHLFAAANDPNVVSTSIRDNRVRLRGRVVRVESSTVGFIAIEPAGFEIYFQPRIKDHEFYKSDAATQTMVDFTVAFTYEKPRAYDVVRTGRESGRV